MYLVVKLRNIIAYICITALLLCAAIAGHTKEQAVKVPIIMYHSILKSNPQNSNYIVSPRILENDLAYLQKNGYTAITVNDLIDYVYNGGTLPEKPIMLTFDDGHYNNYFYAYPLMEKYNMKMVISVVGEYTDAFTENDDSNPNYSYLTWSQIEELQKSGYAEIQNHTYSMHSVNSKRSGCMINYGESVEEYQEKLYEDLSKMQNKLKQASGVDAYAFTYPFGKVCDYSFDVIKKLGFKASFSCAEGISEITLNPECLYMLKRYIRPPYTSSEEYFNRILH